MKPPLPFTPVGVTSRMTRSASKEKAALLPAAKSSHPTESQTEQKGTFFLLLHPSLHICLSSSAPSSSLKKQAPLIMAIQKTKEDALCWW